MMVAIVSTAGRYRLIMYKTLGRVQLDFHMRSTLGQS
jgi:hypothetical protein